MWTLISKELPPIGKLIQLKLPIKMLDANIDEISITAPCDIVDALRIDTNHIMLFKFNPNEPEARPTIFCIQNPKLASKEWKLWKGKDNDTTC